MSSTKFSEVFPTRWSALIFLLYMSLFVSQGLLITKSQESTNVYNYNTVLAVLVTEMVKFVMCVAWYCSRNSCASLFEQTRKNIKPDEKGMKERSRPVFSSLDRRSQIEIENITVPRDMFFSPQEVYGDDIVDRLTVTQWSSRFEEGYTSSEDNALPVLWLYFIPAFLYCLYNNLAYINLLNYDPATYFILLQLRVVITGVLFQILFKKILTSVQWMSLILLTVGCMIKNLNFNDSTNLPGLLLSSVNNSESVHETQLKHDGMSLNFSTCLIILQVLFSCFAGVYSEFLLKSEGLHVDMFVQNAFLYIDSIACNMIVLCWQWNPDLFTQQSIGEIVNLKVILVILNNAAVGIVTSFFLKYLNSILKTVASALELVFITILSWLFFGVPITMKTILSILVVSFSIILYSRNPVQNPARSVQHRKIDTEEV